MSKVEFHYNRLQAVKNGLQEQDKVFLSELYYRRLILLEDAYFNYYEQEYETLQDFVRNKLSKLMELSLITTETIHDEWDKDFYIICLASDGVGVVRQILDLPNNVITKNNVVLERHYWRACNLRPKDYQIERKAKLSHLICEIERCLPPDVKYKWTEHLFFKDYMKFSGSDGVLQLLGIDIHFHYIKRENDFKKMATHTYAKYVEELGRFHEREVMVIFIVEKEEWQFSLFPLLMDSLKDHYHHLIDYTILTPRRALEFVCSHLALRSHEQYAKEEKILRRVYSQFNRLQLTPVQPSDKAKQILQPSYRYKGVFAESNKYGEDKFLYPLTVESFFSLNTFFGFSNLINTNVKIMRTFTKTYATSLVVLPNALFYSECFPKTLTVLNLSRNSLIAFTTLDRLESSNSFKEAFAYYKDGEEKLYVGLPNPKLAY